MIKRQTQIFISDDCGVTWLLVFHIYIGFFKKTAYISQIVRGIPTKITHKFFSKYYKKKKIKKKQLKIIICRTKFRFINLDLTSIKFFDNAGIFWRRRFKSKYYLKIIGCSSKLLFNFRLLHTLLYII